MQHLHKYLTIIKILGKDQTERILNAGMVLEKRQQLTDINQDHSER